VGKIVDLKPQTPDPGPPADRRERIVVVVTTVLLLVGIILILGASWLTWRSLDDYTVFRVLIPGVVGGLVCIVIAVTLISDAKSKQRNRNRTKQ